ncbi:uncharacterized protein G2W53_040423 [Senna tora]|uniref:Uncharacterized protein n=1 Tax=Senna tora TaxID=362788 RepID=A0A834SDI0_9FABA|nr:uncharacterized protein G2W53_040423 [Senna tora]
MQDDGDAGEAGVDVDDIENRTWRGDASDFLPLDIEAAFETLAIVIRSFNFIVLPAITLNSGINEEEIFESFRRICFLLEAANRGVDVAEFGWLMLRNLDFGGNGMMIIIISFIRCHCNGGFLRCHGIE